MPSSRLHPIRLLLPIFLAGLCLALGLAFLQNSARAHAAAEPEGLPVFPSGLKPEPAFTSPDTPAFLPIMFRQIPNCRSNQGGCWIRTASRRARTGSSSLSAACAFCREAVSIDR